MRRMLRGCFRSRWGGLWVLVLIGMCVPVFAAAPGERMEWRSGLTETDEGWVEHDGDNMAWSRPEFDDSKWRAVDLDDLGPAEPGWHWYRFHLRVGPGHPQLRLLVAAGDGTYELYVNGVRIAGPRIRSALLVGRPVESVYPITNENGDFAVALRTRVPSCYAAWHLPQFTAVTVGLPTAIEYERQALETQRLNGVPLSICINLLVCLAGLGILALYVNHRRQSEYLFLGLYLFLVGISNGLAAQQSAGLVPLSANFLIADPLIYAWIAAQIEFTYSFAGRRVGRAWRIYQVSLVMPVVLAILTWLGRFPSDKYVLIEAAATAPVGLILSMLLFAWYRRGNREAGWLFLPSLAPAVSNALYDLGTESIYLGWRPFNFLVESIRIGPVTLQLVDVGTLLFLLSIAVVMFVRFNRVSREQMRTATELAAAREIQQRLVPVALPTLPNCSIEAAYLPAHEVGGDFYQILPQTDGSVLVVIGDVSGKGLKAAMTGALAIGALRTLAGEISVPAELMGRLNREIARGNDGGFITCLCVRFDPGGAVTIANAGHLAPYKNGEELAVEAGLPLGLVPDVVYSSMRFEAACGDTLILMSDGVVEARSANGELLGFERTRELSRLSAAEIAATAQQFGQEDDITVVRITLLPVAACANG